MKMRSDLNLPEEIVIDILFRLPAKCVGRCRCVSKRWRALLSQSQFIRAHLDRSKNLQQKSLIVCSESRKYVFHAPLNNAHHLFDEILIYATRLSFGVHPDSWFGVMAFCDGLLLVGDGVLSMFVLNPITREIKAIPPGQFGKYPIDFMYGLGYDSAADDYKVVALDTDPMCERSDVFVYSLKNGTWKRAGNCPYHGIGYPDSGVFVDGYFHCLARRTTDHKCAIVAFDMVEEFCEVSTPSSIDSDNFVLNKLAVLGGCLCMFDGLNTDLWVMKEYGVQETWTKFKINDFKCWPLCLLGQERVVMSKHVEQFVLDGEKFAMYNLKQQTSKDIAIIGDSKDLYIDASFVESLISPHASNETGRK